MKIKLSVPVFIAASLLALGTPYVGLRAQVPGTSPDSIPERQDLQTIPDECLCNPDATYYPGSWGGGPNCSGTFGVSWTTTQEGVCDRAGCPMKRPCKGDFTVEATGACASMLALVDEGDGFPYVVGGSEDPYPYTRENYRLDCGRIITVTWISDTMHVFTCKTCED